MLQKNKADVNEEDIEGWTQLMASSIIGIIGHLELCKMLLASSVTGEEQLKYGLLFTLYLSQKRS